MVRIAKPGQPAPLAELAASSAFRPSRVRARGPGLIGPDPPPDLQFPDPFLALRQLPFAAEHGNVAAQGGHMNIIWIAVDWGTSNLRAWAMGAEGPLAEAVSDDGMGKLQPADFEPALLRLISPWLTAPRTPVLACGMVGARQGWREAPYRAVPCAPVDAAGVLHVPTDPRLTFHIAPGLSQDRPADVMRGEETQVAGVLALHKGFDGVICHPGTHSKWVHVSAGEVVSFQTFMTGEIFALLSTQSVLRHSMAEGLGRRRL